MKIVFWDIALCIIAEIGRRFRVANCLHNQDCPDGGIKHLSKADQFSRNYTAPTFLKTFIYNRLVPNKAES
jgi:hypothetical protein